MRRTGAILAVFLAFSAAAGAWDTNDWQFLESIERANLRFFENEKYGPYDLLTDNANYTGGKNSDVTSVAGVGFELTAICLGHYRGWISASNAYEQVLHMMRAFSGRLTTDTNVLKRVNGWTYHWYNLSDGYENSPDGLSLLDHSLFIAGCIFVSEYFKGTEAGELAADLYEQTDWAWRADGDYTAFGYSENLLSIVECAEAPAYKKTSASNMWASIVEPYPRTLQLYFWQYPHCWVDFRGRWDAQGRNHEEIARDSIFYQRTCATNLHATDPAKYDMINSNCWGWTAASASDGYHQMAPWLILGSNNVEWCCDSGSVTPIGLPPCMIFAGAETMAAMKYMYEQFQIKGWTPAKGEMPLWSDTYGFLNCINTNKPWKYYANPAKSNHFWGVNAGIDYGPNVLMLENYKLGSTWRWFMQNPYIATGMYRLGFGAPNFVRYASFAGQTNQFTGSATIGGIWGDASVSYVTPSWTNDYVTGFAVRIAARTNNSGGWVDLGNRDQRGQALVSFWVRGDGQSQVDVGLKDESGRENKIYLADYAGGTVPTNWTLVRIPIERFCMTGNVTNDTWPGSLNLLSFAWRNSGGGTVDVDYVWFSRDSLAPVRPTNSFGAAVAGSHPKVRWNPSIAESDLVGYHVWRRYYSTSGFSRVTSLLAPAGYQTYEDTSIVLRAGQQARYAIQAFDNAEPANSSDFALEKRVFGGRLDLDWDNGVNPNVFGGTGDGSYGPATVQAFDFVYTNLPGGWYGWARRSMVNSNWSGHFIDLNGGSAADYWALTFSARGAVGGEQLLVGLGDTNSQEHFVDLDYYLEGGAVGTSWTRAIIPLSEFTNVNLGILKNLTFLHGNTGEVLFAHVGFLSGQRPLLVDTYFTECENYTRQSGSPSPDYKLAASGGQVLGNGWGQDDGDYADYEFYVARPLTNPALSVRYACDGDDGRFFNIRWDDVNTASITCEHTGGWGDLSNDFVWVSAGMSTMSTGWHKLTVFASGFGDPVNLDCWYLTDSASAIRECENYDYQYGSSTQDLKAGASAGEVLGMSWGDPAGSEAIYSNVTAGAQTGAWFHLWYAMNTTSGRVVDLYLDGQRRARLLCSGTAGWGERVSDFDRASVFIGALGAGAHTVRLAATNGGQAVNLDCFYLGTVGPEGWAMDTDADGLSDRQEFAGGTSAGATDTDGDGIGDGDEVQYGRLGQVSDPTKSDTDTDGLNDRQEWIAGTDPADAASVFQCLEISATNFPMIGKLLRWSSTSNRLYSIYACSNLLVTDYWSPVTNSLPAFPPYNTYTDQTDATGPRAFRIEVHR